MRSARRWAVAVWAMAATVLAQPAKPEKLPPFDVQGMTFSATWVSWIFVAFFIAGSLAIAFKNPRRSHLD
jgi:hypothetical protein